MCKNFLLLLSFMILSTLTYAQRASISTDVIKWGTASPNVGVDIVLSQRLSLNVQATFNPLLDIDFDRIGVDTELRFWLKRPLYSHYFGINAAASIYDLDYKSIHEKGLMVALGLGYGYSFILSERLSLTPSVGVGIGVVRSYVNPELGRSSQMSNDITPVVTKVGISFAYIIN